jgi:hypothetical protein
MPSVNSGRFPTEDVGEWENPQQKKSSMVNFNWQFNESPSLFVGLDEFDYNSAYILPLKLETSDVTPTGFK